jgi:16S rRNA (cytidine1402-2'-O)-methyltransferase
MTTVYLVPSMLADNATETIPTYVLNAVKDCQVIFAENERTARRFLKSMDKTIDIDYFEWFTIDKNNPAYIKEFTQKINEQKNIAIISEAGCPGIADPGQEMVKIAQHRKCIVKPLVGPSAVLLALMASGMNGQHFEFSGYLPIDPAKREKEIKRLEISSGKENSTKIFIETPYRNKQLLDSILNICDASTNLCIAIDITGQNENIRTMTVEGWKRNRPEMKKEPAIFLLYSGQ